MVLNPPFRIKHDPTIQDDPSTFWWFFWPLLASFRGGVLRRRGDDVQGRARRAAVDPGQSRRPGAERAR